MGEPAKVIPVNTKSPPLPMAPEPPRPSAMAPPPPPVPPPATKTKEDIDVPATLSAADEVYDNDEVDLEAPSIDAINFGNEGPPEMEDVDESLADSFEAAAPPPVPSDPIAEAEPVVEASHVNEEEGESIDDMFDALETIEEDEDGEEESIDSILEGIDGGEETVAENETNSIEAMLDGLEEN